MNENWEEIPGRPGYYQPTAEHAARYREKVMKRPTEMINSVLANVQRVLDRGAAGTSS